MKRLLFGLLLIATGPILYGMEGSFKTLDWSIDVNKFQDALYKLGKDQDVQGLINQLEKAEMDENVPEALWEFDTGDYAYRINSQFLDYMKGVITNGIASADSELNGAITGNKNEVKSILNRLLVRAFVEDFNPSKRFAWCECTPWQQRIALIVKLIQEIKEKYTNPADKLVYTSFAAGGLLQDFLLLKELREQGYNNIIINLIDVGYPDPFTLRELFAEFPQEERLQEHIKYLANLSDIILSLQEVSKSEKEGDIQHAKEYYTALNTARIKRLKDELGNVAINNYNSAAAYLARTQKYPNEKSNVLIMVDPDFDFFQIPAYPSLANVMAITITGLELAREEPDFYIFMPKNRPAKIYMAKISRVQEVLGLENIQEETKAILRNKLKNKLVAIAQETGANKQYKTLFRDRILSEIGEYSTNVIHELLNDFYYTLMRHAENRPEISDSALSAVLKGVVATLEFIKQQKLLDVNKELDAITLMSALANPDFSVAKRTATMVDMVMRKLQNLETEISYEISWYTDPYLTFQDLVRNGTIPGAIIYELDYLDPITYFTGGQAVIEKIIPDMYLRQDVVSTKLGRHLTKRESIPLEKIESSPLEVDEDENRLSNYGEVDLDTGQVLMENGD